MGNEKQIIESILSGAKVGTSGKHVHDLRVHNEQFYSRVLHGGSLALGESYMDGWWDCDHLDQFFHRILAAGIGNRFAHTWNVLPTLLKNFILNAGRQSRAFEIGRRHYDIGNDLYRAMLDRRLTYTCGYWRNTDNLDDAQEAKLDLVCRKIGLAHGESVLDIGSGWGSFIGYAAEKYGATAVGLTVSKEQSEFANTRYQHLPISTELRDYRSAVGKFNHVVSLGMFEHVGRKNYRTFMEVAHRALGENGLFLLHTIGSENAIRGMDPWIEKYIFPNSMIPSKEQIRSASEGLFTAEDWHGFDDDYDATLMAWHKNFESNWGHLKTNYDERFHRMWRYYLLSCAGSFRAGKNQLWQIVFSKKGSARKYTPAR